MKLAAALLALAWIAPAWSGTPSDPPRCAPEPTVLSKPRDGGKTDRPEQYLGGGYVDVSFTIDVRGRVRNARVLGGDPEKYFDGDALYIIKRWIFAPVPEPCYWTARIKFGPILE